MFDLVVLDGFLEGEAVSLGNYQINKDLNFCNDF